MQPNPVNSLFVRNQVVEVLTAATLDANGKTDGRPFMPEIQGDSKNRTPAGLTRPANQIL